MQIMQIFRSERLLQEKKAELQGLNGKLGQLQIKIAELEALLRNESKR